MKKIWGLGVVLLSSGLGFSQLACSGSATEGAPAEAGGDPKMEDLIGSVAVNSKSLDGIGSIGFVYDYETGGGVGVAGASSGGAAGATGGPVGIASAPILPVSAGGVSAGGAGPVGVGGMGCVGQCQTSFYAQCTGTLISKSSVLTSRSCGSLLQQGYDSSSLKFAIGADPTQPKRLIDVVDVEFAPALVVNGGVSYPDIAVLHLGESVTDVAAFPVSLLSDDLIGKQLAAVGFGNSDLRYQSGTRRAGALTLNATSGALYPLIFGTFDAFYAYSVGGGYPYYPPYYGAGGAVSGPAPFAADSPAFGGTGGAGVAGVAGAASGGSAGFGLAGAAGAGAVGGGGDDWYRQYLQQQYDSTLLATGEAYLGGSDSDAQPCGADQGGPIVRKLQGQVRVFGVFSRTPFGACERGAIYSSITSATKAFIDTAAQWKDPCTGLTSAGKCVGTTATRCSTAFEGKRRAVKLDCALLNQVCSVGSDTQVACSDK